MKIQKKLINHLTLNGKKETGEKNLMKSIKQLQKNSKKTSHEIFQLALINSTSVFRLHTMKIKKKRTIKLKEIPGFIKNQNARNSMAMKFILSNTKEKAEYFYEKINKEIVINAKNEGNGVEMKNQLQKSVLNKKHFFQYYRWS